MKFTTHVQLRLEMLGIKSFQERRASNVSDTLAGTSVHALWSAPMVPTVSTRSSTSQVKVLEAVMCTLAMSWIWVFLLKTSPRVMHNASAREDSAAVRAAEMQKGAVQNGGDADSPINVANGLGLGRVSPNARYGLEPRVDLHTEPLQVAGYRFSSIASM